MIVKLMFPNSHFFSGLLIAAAIQLSGFMEINGFLIALAVIASLIPDVDGFYTDELRDHHDGYLHAPIFWAAVTILVYFLGFPSVATIGGISVFFHLFTDYVTARTVGIKILYPFSNQDFSLYKVESDYGIMNPSNPDKEDLIRLLNYYKQNRLLVLFEALINLSGLLSGVYLFIL